MFEIEVCYFLFDLGYFPSRLTDLSPVKPLVSLVCRNEILIGAGDARLPDSLGIDVLLPKADVGIATKKDGKCGTGAGMGIRFVGDDLLPIRGYLLVGFAENSTAEGRSEDVAGLKTSADLETGTGGLR